MGVLSKSIILELRKRKIAYKTWNCMFIGYVKNSAAYRLLVIRSDVLDVNTIIEF